MPPCVVEVSLGILAINEAVDHGDTGCTLSALRSPDVGLYGVTPECAETYQRELVEVKRRKMATGEPQVAASAISSRSLPIEWKLEGGKKPMKRSLALWMSC